MARKKSGPDMDFLASMLQQYGGQGADQVKVEEFKPLEDAKERTERNRQLTMTEMEAVLKSQHHRHSLMFKTCSECGGTFQTNYCYVGYCSDTCRRDAFFRRFHVSWDRIRPAQEFEYEDFAVVTPEKTEALYQWAKGFVESYEDFIARTPERPRPSLSPEDARTALDRKEEEYSVEEQEDYSSPYTPESPSTTEESEVPKSPPAPSSNQFGGGLNLDDEVPSFSFP